jgi:hypothetical protein
MGLRVKQSVATSVNPVGFGSPTALRARTIAPLRVRNALDGRESGRRRLPFGTD